MSSKSFWCALSLLASLQRWSASACLTGTQSHPQHLLRLRSGWCHDARRARTPPRCEGCALTRSPGTKDLAVSAFLALTQAEATSHTIEEPPIWVEEPHRGKHEKKEALKSQRGLLNEHGIASGFAGGEGACTKIQRCPVVFLTWFGRARLS